MDLSPACWIWFPSERTLPNTFVLFRHELTLPAQPVRARGWISADSRYLLTVNGRRVQWGPAPCDPRTLDVDPVDLLPYLQVGSNVIGAQVLYYGWGDGTWPGGKPGFIFSLEIECQGGQVVQVTSDASWSAYLDRAHPPGQHKRWYLRALQEVFDARLHPYGWDAPGLAPDPAWLPALVLKGAADKPPLCTSYPDYLSDMGSDPTGKDVFSLRRRQVPFLREVEVLAQGPVEQGRLEWLRDPRDWFDMRTPGAFRIARDDVALAQSDTSCTLPATPQPSDAVFLTYRLPQQVVGWPHFTIEAPEGTVIELMCQESHDPSGPAWLDSYWYAWSRFICRDGLNRFECFDYESLRWLQLHIRNASRPVTVSDVGVRRRVYPWAHEARIRCSEPALQRLFDAGLNTLANSCQEHIVDGGGRERQQYSGDVSHQLHAVRYALGETRSPRRYLRTYSQGLTRDGYFLDTWPAYDRLVRIAQRQVGATRWGPILDHGVAFSFDCWHHYLEAGDLEALREPYPRLLRFAEYLERLRGAHGLLPVEDLGVPTVWIDHDAYPQQRHKQCPFNLYVAAMFQHALAPICDAFRDAQQAGRFVALGREILAAAVARFWSAERGLFVDNLPWLGEEGSPRLSDRSLATSILYDQCPDGRIAAALAALAGCPPEMGFSYPPNQGWRLWALARGGRADVVIRELRERWAKMESVLQNNTLSEGWQPKTDSRSEWSHCPLAPIYVLFMDIAGIRPLEPGFARCQVRPQLGDLGSLDLVVHTVRGPIHFVAEPHAGGHRVSLALPAGCTGELLLPVDAAADLPRLTPAHPLGLSRYALEAGRTSVFTAKASGCPHGV